MNTLIVFGGQCVDFVIVYICFYTNSLIGIVHHVIFYFV